MSEISYRKIYLDIIRVLAMVLVLFNHLPVYSLFCFSSGIKQWIYLFITMFIRINVPLFFMISGSLLLGKEENWGKIFKKRIFRFCFVLIIFESLTQIAAIIYHNICGTPYDITFTKFITGVFTGKLSNCYSYWFLYAYLGMLLILPFLRRVAIKMTKADFIIILFFRFFIWSAIPILNLICRVYSLEPFALNNDFLAPLSMVGCIFYPLIGYYIDEKIDIKQVKSKELLFITILSVIGIIISSLCTIYERGITQKYTENYVQLFDYIIAISVFIKMKWMVENSKHKIQGIPKIAEFFSNLVFGIYLFDPILKIIFYDNFQLIFAPKMHVIFSSILWCAFSTLIGGFITYMLRLNKDVKKIL